MLITIKKDKRPDTAAVPKMPVHMVYHRRFLNDPVHKQVRDAIKAKFS